MNIEKMTSKQIAKEIILRKVQNKLNDEFIKLGLDELRARQESYVETSVGTIENQKGYTRSTQDNDAIDIALREIGKRIDDFKKFVEIADYYKVAPKNSTIAKMRKECR